MPEGSWGRPDKTVQTIHAAAPAPERGAAAIRRARSWSGVDERSRFLSRAQSRTGENNCSHLRQRPSPALGKSDASFKSCSLDPLAIFATTRSCRRIKPRPSQREE